jgi:hypothetical protein
MAFLSDLTREQHRTKAMALVGSSIGLMFALSLVGSPCSIATSAWAASSFSPVCWR